MRWRESDRIAKWRRYAIACLGLTLVTVFPASSEAGGGRSTQGHVVEVSADQAYPESLSWSPRDHLFYVGSVHKGQLGTVDRKGRYRPFIDDPRLIATFGIKVDDRRGRLWVSVDDLGTSLRSSPATKDTLSGVALYDVRTRRRLAWYDLTRLTGGKHLANDLAIGPEGEAYVTDSYAGVIYRIDPGQEPRIFAQSPLFQTGPGLGLNGIAYHPDGFLLASTHNTSEIFRISLADPANVARVAAAAIPKGMDGIAFDGPDRLYAAVNAVPGRALLLVSHDRWQSVSLEATYDGASTAPSAVTIADRRAWLLNSRLNTLRDPRERKVDTFFLQQLPSSRFSAEQYPR